LLRSIRSLAELGERFFPRARPPEEWPEADVMFKRFDKPRSDSFAFLLCTKTLGLATNLVSADMVIIYDSREPESDLQAVARCFTVGHVRQLRV
jgi:SNF2 family DNA or RNA helicase